jgi:hypothetical protein
MNESTLSVSLEARAFDDGHTAHALLIPVYEQATHLGLFDVLSQHVQIPMRTNDYCWLDKLKTLWASIVLGCPHTNDINRTLGAHEPELAACFGLARFPDQSGVNRLLHRTTAQTVAQVREAAFELFVRHSRARIRAYWLRLPGGRRLLVIDLDQRGVVVSSRRYELAEAAFFGSKRRRRGYRLTLAYLGGVLREVLDEHFDPGTTPPAARLPDVLARIAQMCERLGIAHEDVLVRADAAYGTAGVIAQIQAYGFQYLIKGLSPSRARVLLAGVGPEAVFELVAEGEERRWVTEVGEVEVVGRDRARTRVRTRVVAGVWVREVAHAGPRPGPSTRARRAQQGKRTRREVTAESWMTSLEAEDLPAGVCVEIYNGRQTIEAYFKSEQNALGARHVRTHVWAGAAIFQWLVAMTNNVLRWTQQTLFAATELETLGLKQVTHEAMWIPGRVRRAHHEWIVTLERRHPLVRRLLNGWRQLITDLQPGSP